MGIVSDETPEDAVKRVIGSCGAIAAGIARADDISEAESEHFAAWLAGGRHAGMDYLVRHAELRRHPSSVLPGARSVICVAFSFVPPKRRDAALPSVSCYAYGRDYHDVLRKRLRKGVEEMERMWPGHAFRICVDSAPLAERYWALKAGIGITGRNGSVIVKGAGAYCFLAEIVTTVPLEADKPSEKRCMMCNACVKACPTKALSLSGTIDCRRCLSYLTIEHRGEWTPGQIGLLDAADGAGVLFGCDRCIAVCPHNHGVLPTEIGEFHPSETILSLTAEHLADASDEEISTLLGKSAIKRAKGEGLRRNAANILRRKPRGEH